MQRVDSLEKTLMLGGIGGRRRRGRRRWDVWMASSTQWTWVWVNSRSWWWTGRPGVLQFMGSQRVGHDWSDLAAAAAGRPGVLRFMGSQRIGHDWATELNWRIRKNHSKKEFKIMILPQSSEKETFTYHNEYASLYHFSEIMMLLNYWFWDHVYFYTLK